MDAKVEPELNSDDLESLRNWVEWALGELRRISDNEDQLRADAAAVQRANDRLNLKVKEQEEAIKGFEAWQRRGNRSPDVYELGTEVRYDSRVEGKITGVILDERGLLYKIRWWA